MLKGKASELSMQIVSQKDSFIMELIEVLIKRRPTIEEIKEKGMVAIMPDKSEIFSFDKTPLIQFYPIKFEQINEDENVKMIASQPYKILI